MPFRIIRADLTTLPVDAIVNATDPGLSGEGGVDAAIHRAAGPALREYCRTLGVCAVGEARLSPGFRLPARWVIHTAGPVWCGGEQNEEALLAACYRSALTLALETGCRTVAFPLLCTGEFGFPRPLALHVAVREIGAFLLSHELEVTLAVYDGESYQLSGRLFAEVQSYLDRCMPAPARPVNRTGRKLALASMQEAAAPMALPPLPGNALPSAAWRETLCAAEDSLSDSLDQRLRCLDESFSQMLLRKIDEKGMTDAACYKRANVDRKLFSKIRSDPGYRPSKPTAIAFAIALELPLEEAQELLKKAGFALSHSNKFDVIIEYFITTGNYDIFQINETLFAFDQNLLGA